MVANFDEYERKIRFCTKEPQMINIKVELDYGAPQILLWRFFKLYPKHCTLFLQNDQGEV